MTCQAHPVLVKKANQICGSFLLKLFHLGGYLACLLLVSSAGLRLPRRSGPPLDGPKDPWPRVLSLPERFVGDPVALARNNMLLFA